jgi:hypothetical protein
MVHNCAPTSPSSAPVRVSTASLTGWVTEGGSVVDMAILYRFGLTVGRPEPVIHKGIPAARFSSRLVHPRSSGALISTSGRPSLAVLTSARHGQRDDRPTTE